MGVVLGVQDGGWGREGKGGTLTKMSTGAQRPACLLARRMHTAVECTSGEALPVAACTRMPSRAVPSPWD